MNPPLKPFERMTADDYAAIGLKCGLEVHQQLLTKRKLFCRCPAGRYRADYDAEVLRHMRPTLSELGEYDGTALMEKKTRKNIFYRIHHDTVCTYEFDDTPPFFPDPRAIDIALEISMLLDLNLVSEIHIARKQYLDGSIPTGFQRTAILGVSGSIPYRDRRIGITQLSIEEDSCREVSDVGHDRVLLTDRLGMPLIETVTDPDMRTPQEAAEVCQLIRLLARSTGKVRTGYGAGREDVNVSVRGGTRIEIKGVPQIQRIPLLVHNEAVRQCALLRIRDELQRRGVTDQTLHHSAQDVTRAVARSHFPPIREAVDAGHRVFGVDLGGFVGMLNEPTQEQTTFAREFSDRIRVIACLTQLPNMVHSDTAADLLSVRDWKDVRRRMRAGDGDALILVWGPEADCRTACEEIAIRAREATRGVPSDTRQAHKDGTNGFERVLPGPERMYPDTDLPPMRIAEDRLRSIRAALPEPIWQRLARYEAMRLPKDIIEPLAVSPSAALFDRLVDELRVDPVLASVILIQRFKAFRRAGLRPERLGDAAVFAVFAAFAEGRLAREGIAEALESMLRSASARESDDAPITAAAFAPPAPMHDRDIDSRIRSAVAAARNNDFSDADAKHRWLMGRLMRDLSGSVAGRRLGAELTMALHADSDRCAPQRTRV
jgi:glutamyl-tRNA(Gln) amidotransferase subunit E